MPLLQPFTTLLLDVEVENAEGQTLTCSRSSYCRVYYRWDYTPLWHGQAPKVVYPGQSAVLFVNPQRAQDYKKEVGLAFDWKIDGIAVDMDGVLDFSTKLAGSRTSYVKGKVMSEERTWDAHSTIHFNGAGYAYRMAGNGETCNIDMTDCYATRVLPTISSMSASTGYTTGGQRLTLHGTSLDGTESVEVLIDGEPCYVTANSND